MRRRADDLETRIFTHLSVVMRRCAEYPISYTTCNHILALLLKLCKFTLYECRSITDLDSEEDMQPKHSCTSSLQQWHRKGRGDSINPQPVMEVLVTKTSLDQDQPSKSRAPGVKVPISSNFLFSYLILYITQ